MNQSDFSNQNSWQQQIAQHWQAHDYETVAELCEQAIEAGSAVTAHYWYLGLAQLLQGQEMTAQATWMVPLMADEAEQAEAGIQELLEILEREANEQQSLHRLEQAWLIRQHLREIAPQDVNNLLRLVQLAVQLDRFTSDDLINWRLIDTLTTSKTVVDLIALSQTIDQFIERAQIDSTVVRFLAAASTFAKADPAGLVHAFLQTANRLAYGQNRPDVAIELTNLCLKLDPEDLTAQRQLAGYYQRLRRYEEGLAIAEECYRASTTTAEQLMANLLVLHSLLRMGGHWQRAWQRFQLQLELLQKLLNNPPPDLDRFTMLRLVNTLFFYPYLCDDPEAFRSLQNRLMQFWQSRLREIHYDLVERYEGRSPLIHAAKETEERRLRIGYISHCLKRHSVGWIVRWLIQHHCRERFEIYLYFVGLDDTGLDSLQDWFVDQADRAWRVPANAPAIAEQVFKDEIDILVDLDSLTVDTTCEVLALKPAPVQVSWLGWDAPGLPAVDYFIADPYVVLNEADRFYCEKIWRLPQTYVAVDGFEVGIPSLRRSDLGIPDDAVVYYCTQRGQKLHPETVDWQMQILAAVPHAYYLTKVPDEDRAIKEFFKQAAAEWGVSGDRLRFLPDVSSETTHRANLSIADVVLDTYPYNGATTTLETLWMGVPLVTRVGKQFSSRNSYTMMVNVGLQEGIAWTDEEYIRWGVELGTRPELRQKITLQLRQARYTAPLWNTQQFAREMENAYLQMWREKIGSMKGMI